MEFCLFVELVKNVFLVDFYKIVIDNLERLLIVNIIIKMCLEVFNESEYFWDLIDLRFFSIEMVFKIERFRRDWREWVVIKIY